MGAQHLKAERLNHLAEIMKNMDEHQAMDMLAELEQDIRFDRSALSYIAKKLFSPMRLFRDLADDELRFILKPLDDGIVKALLEDPDRDGSGRCAGIIGKTRMEDALSSHGSVSSDAVMDEVLAGLGRGISEGMIKYNGIALLLTDLPCRPGGKAPKKKEHVFFRILNPLTAPGQGISILIYAPARPNANVRVSLQGTGKRFFDKDTWFKHLKLDERGLFLGEIFPREEPGPATVWVEVPESGQASRTVFFSQAAKSVFSINIISVITGGDGRTAVTFRLEGQKSRLDGTARVTIYCSRCGVPLGSGQAQVIESQGSFEFAAPEGEFEHPHDYYMHVFAGEHQAGTVINTQQWRDEITPLHEEKNRIAGDAVEARLPAGSGDRIFFHVSSSAGTDRFLRHLVTSGTAPLRGAEKSPSSRKASPLETDLAQDRLILLSQRRGAVVMDEFEYDEVTGFTFIHHGVENITDLYFTFYRIGPEGIKPLCRHVSYLKRVPQVYPENFLYIEEGEDVEIRVGYYLPPGGTLTVNDDDSGRKALSGTGIFPLRINADDTAVIEWRADGHTPLKKEISFIDKRRSLESVSIDYAPPGTLVQPTEKEKIELFGGPGDVADYFFRQELLNYPWGCSEQTSAKITAFCIRLAGILPVAMDHVYIVQIKNGIKHMLTFRNSDGLYCIFENNHGIEATSLVLGNIAPVMDHRAALEPLFPELFEAISWMRRVVRQSAENAAAMSTAQFQAYTGEDDEVIFSSQLILESTQMNLIFRDDRLHIVSRGLRSLPAYCCEVATAMLRQEAMTISVQTGRKKILVPQRRTGFAGLLESFRLLKPKMLTKEKTTRKKLENALETVLQSISIRHITNSYASTVETMAMLLLLNQIRGGIESYRYSMDGTPVTVEGIERAPGTVEICSPFTFVKRIFTSPPDGQGKKPPSVRVSSRSIAKGGHLKISYRPNSMGYEVYNFILPPLFAPAASSHFIYRDQSAISTSHHNREIALKAERRGRGMLKLLVEDMYDPARTYLMDLGWIEVV